MQSLGHNGEGKRPPAFGRLTEKRGAVKSWQNLPKPLFEIDLMHDVAARDFPQLWIGLQRAL